MNYQKLNRLLIGAAIALVGLVMLTNSNTPAPSPSLAPVSSAATSPAPAPIYHSDDDIVAACKQLLQTNTLESNVAALELTLQKTRAQRYSFLSVGCTVYQILPFSAPDRWTSDLNNQILRAGEHTRIAVRHELALATKRQGDTPFPAIFKVLFPDDDPTVIPYDNSLISMAALAKLIVATAALPSEPLDAATWNIFTELDGRFYDNYDLLDNKSVEDDDNLVLACAARLTPHANPEYNAAFLNYAIKRAPESKYYRGPLEALIQQLQAHL